MSGPGLLNDTTMTEQQRGDTNNPRDGHHHVRRPPDHRRRRRVRIEQEIDLYCNPFVEVYLRMSKHLRRKCRKMLLDLTDLVLEFQDNVIFRNIFVVANFTLV